MITIIICVVLWMIIAFIQQIRSESLQDFSDYLFTIFGGLILGVFTGFLIAWALPADTEIEVTTYNIESLQDNNSISGNFFLGCGQINGTMKYIFYYEINGAYKIKQLNCNNVSIKYSDDYPIVKQYNEVCSNKRINLFAFDFTLDTYYIIYVPKGTIKQNYNLDAI